ncbi:MAG: nickel pincer cofactor biosynthesis protein LarC [Thermodesulfovibrionales bacterium]
MGKDREEDRERNLRIAYLDCFAGISGDMLLGAIVDTGIPLVKIEEALKALPFKGYRLGEEKVKRSFIKATKVTVRVTERKRVFRRWDDIKQIINESGLPNHIKERGLRIFKSLFEAEGKIHGEPYDKVHLHELGAIDCLIDVFGSLIGFDLLGVEKVFSSPVNLGSGLVKGEHGLIPVPSPAVLELLKDRPVYSSGPSFEFTTPTGAAIIKDVVNEFRAMPSMNITGSGYGAGTMDFEDFPNTLRIITGEVKKHGESEVGEYIKPEVIVIETNIDDMNPQVYEYLVERLFEAGAIDVFLTQVIMKKGRPGILLTVLCEEINKDEIARIIFKETTTLGLRFYRTKRLTLEREIRTGHHGKDEVRIKVARYEGKERTNPEYEDCKKIAREKGIPLIDVIKEVKVK